VAGAILAPSKRTLTAALRILRREQENDFPIYHGVLNRAVWSSRVVAGWLLRLLVAKGIAYSVPITIVSRKFAINRRTIAMAAISWTSPISGDWPTQPIGLRVQYPRPPIT